MNQFHRAQVARARGDAERTRQRYYDALSLESPPPLQPLRDAAQAGLAAIYAAEGVSAADAQVNIARELERRRDERRRALLSTAVGKALPALPTTDLAGTPASLGRPGQVTLLNFFAAWCGACRQEIPLIQQVYDRYKDDPAVRFVLVSLDDDPKRLERYVAERKFQMPVLRMTREQAAAALDVQDTPWTFYVDAGRHHPLRGARPGAARRRGGADQPGTSTSSRPTSSGTASASSSQRVFRLNASPDQVASTLQILKSTRPAASPASRTTLPSRSVFTPDAFLGQISHATGDRGSRPGAPRPAAARTA